ncbi:XRE family transcriptional regulator [Streptomyces sp. NBC_01669]|uniref:XRE family transcriptional regulator n=1 Tax=Streptomyces sp. NBC_01669 TaxID=2975909 RepID=UPI0022596558|nr:XRE family transcriptional regulator [Streptomyces sp. NBC_01669]MCX4531001.1 XRE family transcriptional regulator [Streptomyces sp. NBC_01669]
MKLNPARKRIMEEPNEGQMDSKGFMDRLNRLFDTVHPPNRGPFSNAEVADLMEERGLGKLSAQYLWLLRTGQRDNPTKRHLEALAGFFGVDPAYWFDDAVAEKTLQELELLALLRDAKIKNVLLRLSDVSADGKEAILGIVESVRKSEGLPPSTGA